MTELNKDDLAKFFFTTYERMRDLAMSDGAKDFMDETTLVRMQVVEDGGELSHGDQLLVIQKCWVVKCALRAMGHLDNDEEPITVPKSESTP